jgi:hypothetical protein
MWEINNLGWDDITEYPELNTVEIWRFMNDSGVSHPMHMHLVQFLVLDRDTFTKDPNGLIIPGGNPQLPPAEEDGWKDTVMVGPNEITRVIARFEGYKGKYPYHCHILEHEDHEMMRQFQTVSCGDGEIDPTEACDNGAANGTAQSCCTASCDFAPELTACDDANVCTIGDQCDAGGVCLSGPPLAPPGEVTNVQFDAGAVNLFWDPIPGAPAGTVYDAARGVLSELPVGSGAGEVCLQSGMSAPPASDAAAPAAGNIHWYVLRGRHLCGTGTYGTQETNGIAGAERVTAVCP